MCLCVLRLRLLGVDAHALVSYRSESRFARLKTGSPVQRLCLNVAVLRLAFYFSPVFLRASTHKQSLLHHLCVQKRTALNTSKNGLLHDYTQERASHYSQKEDAVFIVNRRRKVISCSFLVNPPRLQ